MAGEHVGCGGINTETQSFPGGGGSLHREELESPRVGFNVGLGKEIEVKITAKTN